MKKILLTLLALSASSAVFAQVEIGLKLAPSITSLRVDGPSDSKFASGDTKLSLGGGLLVDYFFGENYAVSTGLFLTGRGGTFMYADVSGGVTGPSTITARQKFSTQYLEIPASVKLFTNEISDGTRVYLQVGAALAVPVGTRINGGKLYKDPATNLETKSSDHVFFFDANALLGGGVEYQLGTSTKIFGGLSYHRGLIDIDRYFEKTRKFKDVSIKNSEIALDLGIKF